MRPGASARWKLPAGQVQDGAGARLEVDLAFIEGETSVELGGRVLVGGRESGQIEPTATDGPACTRTFTFELSMLATDAFLELTPDGLGESPLYMRVRRVRLYRTPTPSTEDGARSAPALSERPS